MHDRGDIERRARERVGRVLDDKYTLDALLGVGGMAAVYAATHRNKKRAAVKILHPELSVDSLIRARFLREGYVANTVGHHGAVAVHDDQMADDGCAYLVMELLEGESLAALCKRMGKRLPPNEVLALTHMLLDTLAAAHDRGVLHRDLKPENLFLTTRGELKVLDFGIARLRQSESDSPTQTGDLMGTPSFMSPEQARGRWSEVDHRSDLWSCGAVMYTLLTGELVHDGESASEALVKAVMERAPPITQKLPDLHHAVVSVVDRALAYPKAERFESARAMQAAVADAYTALTGDRLPDGIAGLRAEAPSHVSIVSAPISITAGGLSSPAGVPESRPTRWWIAVGAAVLVGAGVGVLTLAREAPRALEPLRWSAPSIVLEASGTEAEEERPASVSAPSASALTAAPRPWRVSPLPSSAAPTPVPEPQPKTDPMDRRR